MERDSHNELMRRAGDALVAPAVEHIVGTDAEFIARWDAVVVPLWAEMMRRADEADAINRVNFGCNFNFAYSPKKNGA